MISKKNLHLSLSSILTNKENKNKEQQQILQKKVHRILCDPLSRISYYQGKVPLMSMALKQVAKPSLKTLRDNNNQIRSYSSIFERMYINLNFVPNLVANQRNPYEYPPEYNYQNTQLACKRNTSLTLYSLPNIAGFVNIDTFYQMLSIYENNQQYYLVHWNDYDYDVFRQHISQLEQWFIHIIEPIPIERHMYSYWFERENSKYLGSSFYCHELLYSDLLPLNFSYLIMYHSQLVNVVQS